MEKLLRLSLLLLAVTAGGLSITLDGAWTGTIKYCGEVTSDDCTKDVVFPAVVPGGIYTDLSEANLIGNNFYGKNDMKHRWIGNQTVTYRRHFDANVSLLNAPKVVLVFHGLDTYATIYVNDQKVGRTSNMFVRYTFDVTKHLKKTDNILKVVFLSAVKVAESLYNEQALRYKVVPVCVPEEYNGECHVNHIRKMQASFSWDWGPAFPSMGIWRSVELIPVNEILLADVTTDVYKEENTWRVVVTLYLEMTILEDVACFISSTLHVNEELHVHSAKRITVAPQGRYATAKISINVSDDLVEKWWPNGYGNPKLYKLTVIATSPGSVMQKELRIGFRTVELVQDPLKEGLSFYFRINGVPMFAKGSNFIPASVFPELGANKESIRNLLASSRDTHMNMLRVWGGGVYESELFYDLADEYGIMIWQDFMFACAMYPVTDGFLESVREEVAQNVRRLKNHASVVIWAGNNENEAALYGNWYGTGREQVYADDYIKLYAEVIKTEVEQLDNTRPYVVSSPSNGLYAEEYNYVGVNPYLNTYGDVHYYNYLKNGWDITQYPRARFSSEYGFQSLPSIYTIAPTVETITDLNVNSEFMRHRQHLPFGMAFLNGLISRNLQVPRTNNSLRDFVDVIYLSQINQAVSVKIESEFYRQAMSEVNSIGEGMTMGALYWQLNDVWQAPSWASIDIDGRWKMLHYYAQEFFAPVIVTSYLSEANDLSIYVVSDKLEPVADTTVEVKVHTWNSLNPIYTQKYTDITIEANKAKSIGTFWLNKFLSNAGCGSLSNAKTNCIVTLTLKDRNGSTIAPINYVYPSPIKDVNLPTANLTINVIDRQLPGRHSNYPDLEIELTTNEIALFVWLEGGNVRGRFSENGFHMFEGRKRVLFHASEAINADVLRKKLRVTTLSDLYDPNRRNDQDEIAETLNFAS